MKRPFFLWMLLCAVFAGRGQSAFTTPVQGKNYILPPSLAVHFVFNDFRPVSIGQQASLHERKAGLAASYLRGIGSRFEFSGMIVGSILRFPFRKDMSPEDRQLLLLEADISIRYKLLYYPDWLTLYWQTGLGGSHYDGHTGLFLPFGPGARINLSELTFLLLDVQYRTPLTSDQTGHFLAALGWGGIINKKKRPVYRPVVKPPIPVSASAKKIDTDGDGVPDSLDACPEIPGLAQYEGCPDSDGDGIPDNKDRCPLRAGLAKYDGCPPPVVAIDSATVKTPALVRDSLVNDLQAAARRIFFATNKYELLPASFPALNEVVALLRRYPLLEIEIGGHTDNRGNEQDNLLLSERRAHAVLEYLQQKGTPAGMNLSARGYGLSRPISTNNTAAGRALNRRVEFRIIGR